ncbi:MAG: PAS domain S-box protein [Lacibacter sp.]
MACFLISQMPSEEKNDFELDPFFEMTPDFVCVVNKEGYFIRVNQSVIKKLGYSKDELMSQPVSSFIHPADKELTAEKRTNLLSGQPLLNFQNRYVAKDGAVVWLDWTSIYFPEREIVFAIAKDVSSRKAAEKEIEERFEKFKSLAGHFKSRSERDRKYIAVELHEELAQLVAVVKMDIDWLATNEPALSEMARKRAEHASVVSDLITNAIRRISFSISPGMLQDIGLTETLKWHCNEFSLLSGIPCMLEGSVDEDRLATEIKLDIFRICQEALHNVLYHAEASFAGISITEDDGHIVFTIKDNGKGFDPQKQTFAQGLINMRERAASVNGELFIVSNEGKGTFVELKLKKNRRRIEQ